MSEMINETIETTVDFVEEKKEGLIDKTKKVGKKALDWSKDKIDSIKGDPVNSLEKTVKIGLCIAEVYLAYHMTKYCRNLGKMVYSKDIEENVILNKKLTNSNKIELDYRMKTGQTKIEALREMGLLEK